VLEEELPRQIARAADRQTSLAIAMIDLDRFRDFNERHGHPAGDIMLQSFGALLQGFRREDDIACRYGGEEFLLLMPATTAAEAAARSSTRAGGSSRRLPRSAWPSSPATAATALLSWPRPTRRSTGPNVPAAARSAWPATGPGVGSHAP